MRFAYGYLGILIVAEICSVMDARIGTTADAVILLALIHHGVRTQNETERGFLWALAVTPLLRVVSVSLPLAGVPALWWYAIVSAPVLVSVVAAMRALGYTLPDVGLSVKVSDFLLVVVIIPVGLSLGIVEYLILRPPPIIGGMTIAKAWQPALILAFAALAEELVFRGLLQGAALKLLGRPAIVCVAGLYTSMIVGYHSAANLVFVFLVALGLGTMTARTNSILGAWVTHATLIVSLMVVAPSVPSLASYAIVAILALLAVLAFSVALATLLLAIQRVSSTTQVSLRAPTPNVALPVPSIHIPEIDTSVLTKYRVVLIECARTTQLSVVSAFETFAAWVIVRRRDGATLWRSAIRPRPAAIYGWTTASISILADRTRTAIALGQHSALRVLSYRAKLRRVSETLVRGVQTTATAMLTNPSSNETSIVWPPPVVTIERVAEQVRSPVAVIPGMSEVKDVGPPVLVSAAGATTADLPPRGAVQQTLPIDAILVERGIALVDSGDSAQAYRLFCKAIEVNNTNVRAWFWRATTAKKLDEIVLCLERAVEIDPGNPVISSNLALFLQRRERWRQYERFREAWAENGATPLTEGDFIDWSPPGNGAEKI